MTMEKGAEKGATRKTSSCPYAETKHTQMRVEAELKEKKEDEEWQKECKARSDEWERKRLDHQERMKNTSAWLKKGALRENREKEEEEKDNILETRFETTEDFGPLQPLPPYPETTAASLDAEWISDSEKGVKEEEKSRKARGKNSRGGKKGGKGTKGLYIKPPLYAQLKDDNDGLRKMLEEKREKNDKKKKEKAERKKRKSGRSTRSTGSDETLKKRSSSSNASTIKDYEDDDDDEEEEPSRPLSRFVAKPKSKEVAAMDAE